MAKLYLGTREITPMVESEQLGIPRVVSSTGVYSLPPSGYVFKLPSSAKDLGYHVLYRAFSGDEDISSIDFSSLTNATGDSCCYELADETYIQNVNLSNLISATGVNAFVNAFAYSDLESIDLSSLEVVGNASLFSGPLTFICYATKLTSVDLHSLREVGRAGMRGSFGACSYLTSVDLSSLETIKGSGLSGCFEGSGLRIVNFPSLSYVENSAFYSCFYSNQNLTDIYFNSLTTTSFSGIDAFDGMFDSSTASTSGNVTIHFPSNLETTVSGLTGYPLFGGSSSRVTLSFDLTATS